jgi:hypothetical protein
MREEKEKAGEEEKEEGEKEDCAPPPPPLAAAPRHFNDTRNHCSSSGCAWTATFSEDPCRASWAS